MKVILLCLCMLLVSCSLEPVLNIEDKPIPGEPSLTLEQTYEAISFAASKIGWELEQIEPGLALATLHLRGHMSEVQIAYTPQKYSITYKNSSDLDYDGEKIDNDYNRWIKNLDKHIQHYLARSKFTVPKETSITVVYDILFDDENMASDDAMDNRFAQEIPILCIPPTYVGVIDVIVGVPCILSGFTYGGAWVLDKIIYHGDTKNWQSCLERLSSTFRDLDGLATVKPPVHTFLNYHKLILAAEYSSELEFKGRNKAESPKYILGFILEGPKFKNIGDDGMVIFEAEAILGKTHYDRQLEIFSNRIMGTWNKTNHQSLTGLCKGQTDNLIKQQIHDLIDSLLKQMNMSLPHLLIRDNRQK